MPRLTLTLLVALIGLLAMASSASAKSTVGPCREDGTGPKCHFWNAKAVFVADGDTIRVRVAGERKNSMIRFIGINAMELSRYSKYANLRKGACHGLEATALVDRMVKGSPGRRVRLSAQRPGSRTGHRLRRSVWVKSGGRWRDLARMVVEQGHALWLPNPDEWAHNGEYHELAVAAAARGKNLWNPDHCGAGPSAGAPLQLSVKYDADGNDAHNINGEWVDIRNTGATPVDLSGWWFRDSWLNYTGKIPGFPFPAGSVVLPGSSIRVHMGRGTNTATSFFWGRREAVFEDANKEKGSGDGAYLFDPQGDLRAHSMYPCVGACTDPLKGAVKLAVQWQGQPEFAAVANVSTAAIDLSGYKVVLHLNGEADRVIFEYALPAGSTLAPGETLKVFMNDGPGPDGRLKRSLKRGQFVLPDGPKGNIMTVRSPADIQLDCVGWNASRCR